MARLPGAFFTLTFIDKVSLKMQPRSKSNMWPTVWHTWYHRGLIVLASLYCCTDLHSPNDSRVIGGESTPPEKLFDAYPTGPRAYSKISIFRSQDQCHWENPKRTTTRGTSMLPWSKYYMYIICYICM
jgi:hypothetical protein